MKKLLFLCTGNYYRSRFAEVFFNHLALQRRLCWQADSRGLLLSPLNAGPLSLHTAQYLERIGVSSSSALRLPLPVGEDDFVVARHIVAVNEREHRPMIAESYPLWPHRVEYWHIDDLDDAPPSEALPALERAVVALVCRFAAF